MVKSALLRRVGADKAMNALLTEKTMKKRTYTILAAMALVLTTASVSRAVVAAP
jgi:hypothetical protein